MSEFSWPTAGLSENALDAIARDHGLFVGPGGKELVGEELDEMEAVVAEIDINFAKLNPNLPIENVCSRLDNYKPQNPTQEAFLAAAIKLVGYRNPTRLAGFIACGGAGLGKTHVAIGVAKASMLTGQKACYINVPSGYIPSTALREQANNADIVVIDDLNSASGGLFNAHDTRSLLAHMHNRGGGKLMVTSNAAAPEAFNGQILLPTNRNDRIRIQDRIASALMGLTVEGTSYRSQNAAGQTPWWEE